MDLTALDDDTIALRARLAGDIWERNEFHRGRLKRAGLGRKGVHRLIDLTRLPPMMLDDIRAPAALLLLSDGDKAGAQRRYAPLEWTMAADVPLSYSDDDLVTLAELGSRLLEAAGVQPTDVIANLIANGATREHLQLTLGAQLYGASNVELGPGQSLETIERLEPSVLIGTASELTHVLEAAAVEESALAQMHTCIVVGHTPTPRQYRRLVEHFGGNQSSIVRAWAPEGVLALWGQCRGGNAFHTWPGTEIVEIVDPLTGLPVPVGMAGKVVWTGIGWYATAVIRLDSDTAVVAADGICPTCGRKSMRIEPMEHAAGFSDVLDASVHVRSWAAELQRNDKTDELVIWVVPNEGSGLLELLTELNLKIGPVQVQLTDEAEIERRVADRNGERFGDSRAF